MKRAVRETFHSLSVRNFRLFFIGQGISQVGNWFTLITQTQGPFKARIEGKLYENLIIKSLNDGSANEPTVTLLMPTPVGEADRFITYRLDQVEVVQ